MPHNIAAFFDSYANLYNRALAGESVFGDIAAQFSPRFIAAGPEKILTGKPDAALRRQLTKMYDFYRSIGTKKVTAKRVETTPIDASHVMAKVFYCGEYRKEDGTELKIPFDITYFLDVSTTKPKIFGFVAGDEMALYRQQGLAPVKKEDKPKPRPKPRQPQGEERQQRLH